MRKIILFSAIFIFNFSFVYSLEDKDPDLFQDTTDKYFSEIDSKVENYLSNLNSSKNHCFGKDKKQNFVECINDIEKIFNNYRRQYDIACDKILEETIENSESNYIPAIQAGKFLDTNSSNLCIRMYELKISIYNGLAYEILADNKLHIHKDEKKIFVQTQRTKYSELLDLIRINLGYFERLWKKWPSKTKK